MKDLKSLDLRQLSTQKQKTDDARLGAEWSTQQPCVPQLDGSFVRWVLQMQWRSVPPQDIDSAHERSLRSLAEAQRAGGPRSDARGRTGELGATRDEDPEARARARQCTHIRIHVHGTARARGIHTNVRAKIYLVDLEGKMSGDVLTPQVRNGRSVRY